MSASTSGSKRRQVDRATCGADGRATYRADEVATLLGVGRDTVYQAAERGEIPGALRIGRRLVFSRPVVLAWIGNPAPSEE